MIKKRTLACGVLLVAVILTKLYSSSNLNRSERWITPTEDSTETNNAKSFATTLATSDTLDPISFANEEMPLDIPSVKTKFNKHIKRFSYKKLQSYRMHHQADRFLPQIAEILISYGIPEDFKYIPVVESGLDPRTTSHKGAGGYWQFIPSTARLYGLKVNDSIDERLDFVKSTHAAARYIKSLYKEFGDWTLVAAAYNVGGGSLKKSIRRQGTESYYELNLNRETGSYVYKLVSVKEVIEHPDRYGYKRLAKTDESTVAYEPDMS